MTRFPGKAVGFAMVLYAAAIIVLSLLPSGKGKWDQAFSSSLQNASHLPAYGILVVITVSAFRRQINGRLGRIIIVSGICAALGVILELGQAFIPGRTCSVFDAAVNLAGVCLGLLVVVLCRKLLGLQYRR